MTGGIGAVGLAVSVTAGGCGAAEPVLMAAGSAGTLLLLYLAFNCATSAVSSEVNVAGNSAGRSVACIADMMDGLAGVGELISPQPVT